MLIVFFPSAYHPVKISGGRPSHTNNISAHILQDTTVICIVFTFGSLLSFSSSLDLKASIIINILNIFS